VNISPPARIPLLAINVGITDGRKLTGKDAASFDK